MGITVFIGTSRYSLDKNNNNNNFVIIWYFHFIFSPFSDGSELPTLIPKMKKDRILISKRQKHDKRVNPKCLFFAAGGTTFLGYNHLWVGGWGGSFFQRFVKYQ